MNFSLRKIHKLYLWKANSLKILLSCVVYNFNENQPKTWNLKIIVTGNKGDTKVPIKAINILKAHGGNMKESILVSGYALNCVVACEGMPKKVSGAKIAFLDFSLMKAKMNLGVLVQIEDPEQLDAVRQRYVKWIVIINI